MKKLSIALSVLLLLGASWPLTALAKSVSESDLTSTPSASSEATATPTPTVTSEATATMTPPVVDVTATPTLSASDVTATPSEETEETETTSLRIDDENVYDGMDKAYKNGYTPTVKNGTATIVLPLVANGAIQKNAIMVTPGLGNPSSSPFVYKNYQKTVQLGENAINGSRTTVSSFLVRFDLALSSDRINGVYPVTIDIQSMDTKGNTISQSFTCYVTITDGTNPDAETTVEKETPVSQPKIIVSGYSVNPSPAIAGQAFTVKVTLKNISETQSVQNMMVTVSCDSKNFLLQNDSSTIYINKLDKQETAELLLTYVTDLETPAQRYNITLSIEYDNSEAVTLSSSGTVSVEVTQALRMEIEIPTIESEVNAGDTMPLTFQVMNLGRSTVYNVRVELSAPGLIPDGTAFIGNMEAGTSMTADMDVFIGTKTMTEGYEGEDKYGLTPGVITLIYEDEDGQEYIQEMEFSTTITEPVIIVSTATQEEETETAGQWWISIGIGAAVIVALITLLLLRKKHRRQDV